MPMKITVLIENTAASDEFICEHGLSLYIETAQHNILFDAGQSGAFAENAQKMGIDLRNVDLAVLSHGHYDHGGGLQTFLALNDHAPIYLSRHAFGEYYNGTEKYIGLPAALQTETRIRLVDDKTVLGAGLTLYSCNDRAPVVPLDAYGLTKHCGSAFLPDDFLHEHYLLIEEKGQRVLISGCSHKGILNAASWFEPDVLVGGFHFMKQTDETVLATAADALLAHPTLYFTGHCTGEMQYAFLKAHMGDRLQALTTGKVIDLEDYKEAVCP